MSSKDNSVNSINTINLSIIRCSQNSISKTCKYCNLKYVYYIPVNSISKSIYQDTKQCKQTDDLKRNSSSSSSSSSFSSSLAHQPLICSDCYNLQNNTINKRIKESKIPITTKIISIIEKSRAKEMEIET